MEDLSEWNGIEWWHLPEWWHPVPECRQSRRTLAGDGFSGEGGPDDDGVTVTMIVREARYEFFGHEIGR